MVVKFWFSMKSLPQDRLLNYGFLMLSSAILFPKCLLVLHHCMAFHHSPLTLLVLNIDFQWVGMVLKILMLVECCHFIAKRLQNSDLLTHHHQVSCCSFALLSHLFLQSFFDPYRLHFQELPRVLPLRLLLLVKQVCYAFCLTLRSLIASSSFLIAPIRIILLGPTGQLDLHFSL